MKKILFIMVIFLLFSCEKKQGEWTSIIKGQVTDYYTNESLSSVGLIIEECKTPLVTTKFCDILDTIYTSENGYFNYDLSSIYSESIFDINTFQISAIHSEKYGNSEVFKIEKETINNINLKVKPLKTLRVILQDSSFFYDEIKVHISKSDDFESNIFKQEKSIINMSEYDTVFLNFIPEETHYISWTFYKLGEYKGYDHLYKYLENTDTTEIRIKY